MDAVGFQKTKMLMSSISGKTKLVGLFGWPVSHSFSPAMHNAAFVAAGLNWVYLPFPLHPDDVETAVPALPALSIQGVNVTVPHKQAVMPLLDEIDVGAQAVGAVNTIVVTKAEEGSSLHGYNTDWMGFLTDLREMGIGVDGRSCLVLGAGGSARGVAYGLAQAGGQVQVLARRLEQADGLVGDLRPFCPTDSLSTYLIAELPTIATNNQAPLIVNTTPCRVWIGFGTIELQKNRVFQKNSVSFLPLFY